jgi:dihydrofolate reductase
MEGDKDRSGHWGNPNNEGATGEEYCGMGGATFVSSLMNMGLIDEVRLMVNPIILGGGKALFKDVKERHSLKLIRVKPLKSGMVSLTYSTWS